MKQQLFVLHYLATGGNGTEAARRAGYKGSDATLAQVAHENLNKPEVAAAVEKERARQLERVQIKADEVLMELRRVALTDLADAFDGKTGALKAPKDMPPELRRALSGIEVEDLYEGRGRERECVGQVRKVKFWDKVKALELLGKHLGLFREVHEHRGKVTLEKLVLGSFDEGEDT